METLKSFIQTFAKFLWMLKILLENLISIAHVLGFEIVNHIQAYITGATYSDDVVHFDCDTKFSAKEKSLIAYLSGYVFGAFSRRIRFSKTAHQDQTYHQECLSFLVAGK